MTLRDNRDLTPKHDAMMWWVHQVLMDDKLAADQKRFFGATGQLLAIEWERILPFNTSPGQFPLAFIDILASYDVLEPMKLYAESLSRRSCLGFKIKPAIYSIGEVLRQLRTYKHLEPSVDGWIVVSAKNDLAEKAVKKAGFGWLTVPDGIGSEAA